MKTKGKIAIFTIQNILLVIFLIAIIILGVLTFTIKSDKDSLNLKYDTLEQALSLANSSNQENANTILDLNNQLNNTQQQLDDLTTNYNYLKESTFQGNSSSKDEYILAKTVADENGFESYDSCNLLAQNTKKLYDLYATDTNNTINFYKNYAEQTGKTTCLTKINDYEQKINELNQARSNWASKQANFCYGYWKDNKLTWNIWNDKYGFGNLTTIRNDKEDVARLSYFDMVSVCFSD